MKKQNTEKDNVRIVATGDSMTDTADNGCPALAEELKRNWPKQKFEIINQGVGGTRVGYGLWRLTNEYEFREQTYPPLLSLDPDIVLLESFAYNNASDGVNEFGLKHFREMHTKIVETIRTETDADIVFVVTIAPDLDHFLESVPNFFNTPLSIRRKMAEDRMAYLEEAVDIAEQLNLPLANVYDESLKAAENGTPLATFIDPKDWIHPGKEGHKLIARVIVNTLQHQGIL